MTTLVRRKHTGQAGNGGAFAARSRSEAEVSLLSPVETPAFVSAAETLPTPKPSLPLTPALTGGSPTSKPSTAPLSERDALSAARALAGQYSRGRGLHAPLDLDDVAQEAVVSVAVSIRNGRVPAFTNGLLVTAVRHAIAKEHGVRAGYRQEDYRALRKLERAEDDFIQEQGRMPSARERAAMAVSIRDQWEDKRHRPTPDFDRGLPVMESIDAGGPAAEEAGRIPDEQIDAPDHGVMGHYLSALEQNRVSKAEVKAHAWDALAEQIGVPGVVPVGPSRIRSSNTAVLAEGGPARVAERLLDGEDTPGTRGMLALFGNVDTATRFEIAKFFTDRASSAHRYWELARAGASRPTRSRAVA